MHLIHFSGETKFSEFLHMMGYTMRTDRYRFTKWRKKKQPGEVVAYELYDLKTDPDGLSNIVNEPASERIVRELSNLISDSGISDQVIE